MSPGWWSLSTVAGYCSNVAADDFWRPLFPRPAPVDVEIGAGTGAFLFRAATAAAERNFLALERSRSRARQLQDGAAMRGLDNIHILHADASCVVLNILPDASVSAYHIYFPDPWWKRRHHRRRLFTPAFVTALSRTLVPAGLVYVATDVATYFNLVRTLLDAELKQQPKAPLPPLITRFAQKALQRGNPIHTVTYIKAARPK
jgi:tRNA (guanine-N7-)-methyltransferase